MRQLGDERQAKLGHGLASILLWPALGTPDDKIKLLHYQV